MGYWSYHPMGGDTPLDMQFDVEEWFFDKKEVIQNLLKEKKFEEFFKMIEDFRKVSKNEPEGFVFVYSLMAMNLYSSNEKFREGLITLLDDTEYEDETFPYIEHLENVINHTNILNKMEVLNLEYEVFLTKVEGDIEPNVPDKILVEMAKSIEFQSLFDEGLLSTISKKSSEENPGLVNKRIGEAKTIKCYIVEEEFLSGDDKKYVSYIFKGKSGIVSEAIQAWRDKYGLKEEEFETKSGNMIKLKEVKEISLTNYLMMEELIQKL